MFWGLKENNESVKKRVYIKIVLKFKRERKRFRGKVAE